jgi:hypothetical protein
VGALQPLPFEKRGENMEAMSLPRLLQADLRSADASAVSDLNLCIVALDGE